MRRRSAGMNGYGVEWLDGVLWTSSGQVVAVVDGPLPAGFDPVATYILVPSARKARSLVPSSPHRVTRASFRRFDDATGSWGRARRILAGASLSSPVGRLVGRDRLRVGIEHGTEPSEHVFVAHLSELLGKPGMLAAVGLGPLRPNRKPVLRLLGEDGNTIGYVKVAWNELTAGLVTNEAATLRRLEVISPTTFRAPTVLAAGTWHGHAFTVTSPLPHPVRARGRVEGRALAPVLREIASFEPAPSVPFGETPYVMDLLKRAAEAGDEPVASAIGRVASLSVRVRLGFAHGDWSPWNVSSAGGTVLVWDWERARGGVPIGIDPLHHAFLSVLHLDGRPARSAASKAVHLAGPLLNDLEVPQPIWRPLMRLYLADLALRFHEGRASAGEAEVKQADAIRKLVVERTYP